MLQRIQLMIYSDPQPERDQKTDDDRIDALARCRWELEEAFCSRTIGGRLSLHTYGTGRRRRRAHNRPVWLVPEPTRPALDPGACDLVALLAAHDLEERTIAALLLVPLITMAWADRNISPAERGAILEAAERLQIRRGTRLFRQLGCWLDQRPSRRLLRTWVRYVRRLCEQLTPSERAQLEDAVLGAAHEVARASTRGGLFGSRLHRAERRVLSELTRAFRVGGRRLARPIFGVVYPDALTPSERRSALH